MPFPTHAALPHARTPTSSTIACIPVTFRSDWLIGAASLPGKSLHTALAIAYLASKQKVVGVRMTRRTLAQFHISREAFYDAIRRLEAKKLIRVWRLPGRSLHLLLTEPGSDIALDLRKPLSRAEYGLF
jgi:hypothetical protein